MLNGVMDGVYRMFAGTRPPPPAAPPDAERVNRALHSLGDLTRLTRSQVDHIPQSLRGAGRLDHIYTEAGCPRVAADQNTLPRAPSERVCRLSIDMNCVGPEVAAAEFFWDRLVPGAVAPLDDYGAGEWRCRRNTRSTPSRGQRAWRFSPRPPARG